MGEAKFFYEATKVPLYRWNQNEFVLDVAPLSFLIKRSVNEQCNIRYSKKLFAPYIRPAQLVNPNYITIAEFLKVNLNPSVVPIMLMRMSSKHL